MVNYTINNKFKLLFSLLMKRLRQRYFSGGKIWTMHWDSW